MSLEARLLDCSVLLLFQVKVFQTSYKTIRPRVSMFAMLHGNWGLFMNFKAGNAEGCKYLTYVRAESITGNVSKA